MQAYLGPSSAPHVQGSQQCAASTSRGPSSCPAPSNLNLRAEPPTCCSTSYAPSSCPAPSTISRGCRGRRRVQTAAAAGDEQQKPAAVVAAAPSTLSLLSAAGGGEAFMDVEGLEGG